MEPGIISMRATRRPLEAENRSVATRGAAEFKSSWVLYKMVSQHSPKLLPAARRIRNNGNEDTAGHKSEERIMLCEEGLDRSGLVTYDY